MNLVSWVRFSVLWRNQVARRRNGRATLLFACRRGRGSLLIAVKGWDRRSWWDPRSSLPPSEGIIARVDPLSFYPTHRSLPRERIVAHRRQMRGLSLIIEGWDPRSSSPPREGIIAHGGCLSFSLDQNEKKKKHNPNPAQTIEPCLHEPPTSRWTVPIST